MATFVKGDILNAEHGIIGHAVSCNLALKKGLSKRIKDKYPIVQKDCKEIMGVLDVKSRLGKCQMIQVKKPLFIANLFVKVGPVIQGMGTIDYNALAIALAGLRTWRKRVFYPVDYMPIYLPADLGCTPGFDGEWNVVRGIIMSAIPDAVIVREVL